MDFIRSDAPLILWVITATLVHAAYLYAISATGRAVARRTLSTELRRRYAHAIAGMVIVVMGALWEGGRVNLITIAIGLAVGLPKISNVVARGILHVRAEVIRLVHILVQCGCIVFLGRVSLFMAAIVVTATAAELTRD